MMNKRTGRFKRTFVGCWTCRKRKVKCDAHRPFCQRCEKSNLVCEGYGVQLNWAVIQTVVQGELGLLGGTDISEKEKEQGFFRRSPIEFCRWNLYKYHHELDQDLSFVDGHESAIKGPFTVFRYKEYKSVSPEVNIPKKKKDLDLDDHTHDYQTDQRADQNKMEIQHLVSSLGSGNVDSITPFNNTFLLMNIPHINNFCNDIVPKIFNESLQHSISSIINTSIGGYLRGLDPEFNQCLLSSIIIVSILHNITLEDTSGMKQVQLLLASINQLSHDHHHTDHIQHNENYILLNVLMIMINSKLDVYDSSLFQYEPLNVITGLLPLKDIYQFYQITNLFFNPSQYQIDSKFLPLYEDVKPDYNLLKNFEYLKKKAIATSISSRISISVTETPEDQIIRIPKYFEDDDDVSKETETPPPTFVIHFNSNHSDSNNSDDDDNDEDDRPNELDQEQYSYYTSPQELFQLRDTDNGKITAMGISKHLITLYENCIHLLNQKRSFMKSCQNPRNFPRLCSDFEDILTRTVHFKLLRGGGGGGSTTMNDKDQLFYDFLVLIYFIKVQNYPSTMLSYHLKRIRTNDLGLGVVRFIADSMPGDLSKQSEQDKQENDTVWNSDTLLKKYINKPSNEAFENFFLA